MACQNSQPPPSGAGEMVPGRGGPSISIPFREEENGRQL